MDFYGFISALSSDWISKMSGGASILFAVLGFIKHKKFVFFKSPGFQRKVFWVTALLCFFLASVSAWTNEHQRVINLSSQIEQKNPNFTVDFNMVYISPAGIHRENSIIILDVLIANIGGVSLIKNIELIAKMQDGVIGGTPIIKHQKGLFVRFPKGAKILLGPSDYLPTKCSSRSVDAGGVVGWYHVLLRNVRPEQILSGSAVLIFRFKDVYGKLYDFPYTNMKVIEVNKDIIVDSQKLQEYIH